MELFTRARLQRPQIPEKLLLASSDRGPRADCGSSVPWSTGLQALSGFGDQS